MAVVERPNARNSSFMYWRASTKSLMASPKAPATSLAVDVPSNDVFHTSPRRSLTLPCGSVPASRSSALSELSIKSAGAMAASRRMLSADLAGEVSSGETHQLVAVSLPSKPESPPTSRWAAADRDRVAAANDRPTAVWRDGVDESSASATATAEVTAASMTSL